MLRSAGRLNLLRPTRTQARIPLPRQFHAVRSRPYSTTPTQHQVEVQFGRPFQDFALLLSRFARALVLSGIGLGGVVILVYEGGHQYVEHGLMKRGGVKKLDGSSEAYGWDSELSLDLASLASLGCTEGGGTDRRLGMRARHAVRSAWMCANLGAGLSPGLFFSPAEQAAASVHQASAARHAAGSHGEGGLVDSGMLFAERYLLSAIGAAEEKGISLPNIAAIQLGLAPPVLYTSVDPTALSLELALAAVRERQGTPRALEAAAAGYERIYDALEAQSPAPQDAPARLALLATRIGTAYTDLGRQDRAHLWLDRAIDGVGGQAEVVRAQATEVGLASLGSSDQSSGTSYSWWPFGGGSKAKASPISSTEALATAVPTSAAPPPPPTSPSATRAILGALLARSVLLVSARTADSKQGVSRSRSDLEEALRTQSLVLRLSTPSASPTNPAAELHNLHLNLQHALASLYAAETVYALRSAGVREKEILSILPTRSAEEVEETRRAIALTNTRGKDKGKGKIAATSQHTTTLDLLSSAQHTASSVAHSLSDTKKTHKSTAAKSPSVAERWSKDPALGELAGRLLVQSQRVVESAIATEALLGRMGT